MVMLGEAVGFVADVLQQPKREGMPAQSVGFFLAGDVNFFFPLGK